MKYNILVLSLTNMTPEVVNPIEPEMATDWLQSQYQMLQGAQNRRSQRSNESLKAEMDFIADLLRIFRDTPELKNLKLAYAHQNMIIDSMNEVLYAPDPSLAKNTSGGRILLGISTYLNSLAALQSPRSSAVGDVMQETRNQLNV